MTKKCFKCHLVKEIFAFYTSRKNKDGFSGTCKRCKRIQRTERRKGMVEKSLLEERKTINARRAKSPGYYLKKYWPGATNEQAWDNYQKLLKNQDFKCAICSCTQSSFKKRFPIDHCHKTGKVRGILCHSCNTAIGSLKENPELFQKALSYLKIA